MSPKYVSLIRTFFPREQVGTFEPACGAKPGCRA
jgi:hypothetical protein